MNTEYEKEVIIENAPVEGCFECGSRRVHTQGGTMHKGQAYTYVCTDGNNFYNNEDGETSYHNRGGWFE